MPLAVDLMGVGLPQEQATRLGLANPTTLAGVGTAQSGAAAIRTTNTTLTTSSGQTAAILPSDAELYLAHLVRNSSSTAGLVFPPSGATINAASADASVSIAQNLARVFIRVGALTWISFLTA